MDVYAAIESRRTIRDFADRIVPGEIIEKLIEAGLKAPTNDHMRHWEFVVVNDKASRENCSASGHLETPMRSMNCLTIGGWTTKCNATCIMKPCRGSTRCCTMRDA